MITANIDHLEYIATIQAETTSPLGGTITTELPCDFIRATISIGSLEGHWHYFKPEAIADRMLGYGLEEEIHAVEALVREVVFDWLPDLQPADPTSRIDVAGGIDRRILVTWTPRARADAAELLQGEHAPRIAAFREAISPQPEPAELPPPEDSASDVPE